MFNHCCKLVLIILLSATSAYAQEQSKPISIGLSAVLGKKAVLNVNGQRRIVKQGDITPEGLAILSFDTQKARVKYNNEVLNIRLGAAPLSSGYAVRDKTEVKILEDSHGMYRTQGKINGKSIRFLVDTGATAVAMSMAMAKRLGIDPIQESKGQYGYANTANGRVKSYPIKLTSVTVGGIKESFVPAVVLDGGGLNETLLGMSYLSRLNVKHKNGLMTLTK